MKLKDVKERLEVHHSDLSGSSFDDVNFSGASYKNINMSGSSFDDINMSGWRVDKVNLAGLRLSHANLAGASITNCRLGHDHRGHPRGRSARRLSRHAGGEGVSEPRCPPYVMAGRSEPPGDSASCNIHVDGRVKPGHDERRRAGALSAACWEARGARSSCAPRPGGRPRS